MKMSVAACAGALALLAAPGAQAQGESQRERLVACYNQVKVPAKYSVNKVKIKDAERKYIRRNGRIELVEYPAVYREDKTLVEPAHVVMQEIPCD